ncbi:DUF2586 domain-containing protein [uncultured Victivallis sp.]|uniref:DUF2586 domain-containing protein n=1 Tax=uncultured Victivallis sp. TaxID=354118 RepID=UPI0025863727|nr:DUF2586 domain-containing protein [uncultured Victivallis sp.]
MAVGSVTVVQVDNLQGDFSEVERVFLFIGRNATSDHDNEIIPIDAAADLDELLAAGESELKTAIAAARVNAVNDNFACYALPIAADTDWKEALYSALDKPLDLNVEAVVLCTPIKTKTEVEACQVAANEVLSRFAKFICVFACCTGIEPEETWSEYMERLGALVDNVNCDRVSLVPQLHGNNLGVIAGRLCNPGASLADTPMRVATGALVGLGEEPVDSGNAPLSMATIRQLAEKRFSVPQWYAGYDGMYWADHPLLAAEGSDFSVYENRRVLDYLARRVRILAIGKIADRRLNSTPKSIAVHKMYFARPLREASHEIEVGGTAMPGLIYPPDDKAIQIAWTSRTSVSISITARPYNCPKQITLYLGLDLSEYTN